MSRSKYWPQVADCGEIAIANPRHERDSNDAHERALSRRSFLSSGATVLAGAVAGCGAAEQQPTRDEEITTSVIAQCEKLFELRYTNEERAQILTTLDDQLESIRALRGIRLENSHAPATVFDPRLPGTTFPAQSAGVSGVVESSTMSPDNPESVAFAPVALQAHWIATKQISSRELTRLYLDRIERYQPLLSNYITVTDELALRQAALADKEIAADRRRGPLHGIPYGLKDLVDVADVRTTWGATPYKNRVAKFDAAVVRMLSQAGAVLLGKTTTGALAYGDLWFDGRTRNPWNPEEGSSGSSAGSASATAAGMCGFAIGTETVGSVVTPSSRCGTVGLRPTFGRVPRTGAMALCWSLDKIGPICRSVADTALVLAAINGPDLGDASSIDCGFEWDARAGVAGMRIGYMPALFDSASQPDKAALDALREMSVELVEFELPDWPFDTLFTAVEAEAAAAFQELTLTDRDDELVWQENRAWPNIWRRTHFYSAVDYVQIDRFRRRVMTMMAEKMAGLDAIVSPNYADPLLLITTFTGHPCLTLRIGFIDSPTRALDDSAADPQDSVLHTVPENIMLWGPLFEERKLLTLGLALEKAMNVGHVRPGLDSTASL